MNHGGPCPCCSGKTYAKCCLPLHEGAQPDSAVALMRSRFSAYALGLMDYILQTTHPHHKDFYSLMGNKAHMIQENSQYSFDCLEILDSWEKENEAMVTFTAHVTCQHRDCSFTEKSVFMRHQGRWLYRSGEILSQLG